MHRLAIRQCGRQQQNSIQETEVPDMQDGVHKFHHVPERGGPIALIVSNEKRGEAKPSGNKRGEGEWEIKVEKFHLTHDGI